MCSRAIQSPYIAVLNKLGCSIQQYYTPVWNRCVTWNHNHCKRIWLPTYTNMGKLQSAITLMQRHESTIPTIKLPSFYLCPYQNYVPKCSHLLHKIFFFALVCNFTMACGNNNVRFHPLFGVLQVQV